MSSPNVERFRQLAGGKWALSWQAVAMSMPLGFIYCLTVLIQPANDPAIAGAVIVCAALVCIAMAAWAYVMSRWIFPNREVQLMTVPQIIFGGVSTAVIFWALLALCVEVLGINDPVGTWTRLIINILSIPWWSTSVSLLFEARERFTKERQQLVEQAIQVEVARSQSSDLVSKIRHTIAKEVAAEMNSAQREIESLLKMSDELTGPDSWTEVSDSLRRVASDVVRPLSKRLWDRADVHVPRLTIGQVLRNIVCHQYFRPIPVVMIFFVTTGIAQLQTMPQPFATTFTAVGCGFIVGLMLATNRIMRRMPQWHAHIFLSTVAAFQLFDFVIALIRSRHTGADVTLVSTATDVVGSLSLLFMTSGFGSLRLTADSMIRTFQTELTAKQIQLQAENRQVALLAVAAAKALHGQVQTRLVSCAAAIDQSTATGNIETLNSALQEARLIFDNQIFENENSIEPSIGEIVHRKCDLWLGLCECTIAVTDELLHLSGTVAHNVGAIVEEAVTNAVRHGKADRVWIDITRVDEDYIQVVIRDNGVGYSGGSPNVGFNIYALATRGNFELLDGDTGIGAILRAIVAAK